MFTLTVNGSEQHFDGNPDMPLLWYLRDVLGHTGTKFGCGMALCGACTVHLEGNPTRSCITPVSAVGSMPITTIEAMEFDGVGRVVQQAWDELGVAQCGYCQAGQIMAAVGLLKAAPNPSEQQIDEAMSGNICRCGTYPRIRAAVKLASTRIGGGAR